jgi:hypothetical protein
MKHTRNRQKVGPQKTWAVQQNENVVIFIPLFHSKIKRLIRGRVVVTKATFG